MFTYYMVLIYTRQPVSSAYGPWSFAVGGSRPAADI